MLVLCSQSSSAKKKKKITGGARLQLIYIYSLATTAWPGLRMALAVSETSLKRQSGRYAIDARDTQHRTHASTGHKEYSRTTYCTATPAV